MIQFLFRFNQPDSTTLFNLKDKDVVPQGVWKGGQVLPHSVGLSVDVQPFVLTTIEGATVRDDVDVHNVPVPADGAAYYIGVLHKYVPLGSPVVQVMRYGVTDFAAWVDKDFFTILAKVQVAPGSLNVSADDIDVSCRQLPKGRLDSVIFIVPTHADLPATPDEMGATRYVLSEERFYIWDGSAWRTTGSEIAAGTAAFRDGGAVVQHNIGHTQYRVAITAVADPEDDLGEVWVDKQNNQFTVYRGGSTTVEFDWVLALA